MAMPRRLERLPSRRMRRGGVVHEATTARTRLLGLAFLRELPPGHALLIPGCRSVHTFGVRFAIDIVFLDENGAAVRVERAVGPRRVLCCRRAFAVLETRAGEAALFSPLSRPAARAARSAP
jgi:uncharacterized membrane protein (UPF0127 family)